MDAFAEGQPVPGERGPGCGGEPCRMKERLGGGPHFMTNPSKVTTTLLERFVAGFNEADKH